MLRFGESSTRARRWVTTQGFRLADEEPGFDMPVLPGDITTLHEEDLMELFGQVNAWLDYVEVALVAAQIDAKQADLDLEKIQALETVTTTLTAKNVSEAKSRVFLSDAFTAQRDEFALLSARAKMLETVYNSLDRRKFIISREISRRKGM